MSLRRKRFTRRQRHNLTGGIFGSRTSKSTSTLNKLEKSESTTSSSSSSTDTNSINKRRKRSVSVFDGAVANSQNYIFVYFEKFLQSNNSPKFFKKKKLITFFLRKQIL